MEVGTTGTVVKAFTTYVGVRFDQEKTQFSRSTPWSVRNEELRRLDKVLDKDLYFPVGSRVKSILHPAWDGAKVYKPNYETSLVLAYHPIRTEALCAFDPEGLEFVSGPFGGDGAEKAAY